ncbi:DUF106 domain-containing protein [Candidatus Pacearchaeota archaeon]|nr:DUF106 domain-containing protein [Candidatus Pacearchaeota archaeon]
MELIVNIVREFPLLGIALFSFVITLLLTLLYKKFTNQEKSKERMEKQKEFREKQKQFRDEPQKLLELQNEMMQMSMEQMRESFKPLLISFLPLIFAFGFLKQVYTDAAIGEIISWQVNLPLVGTGAGWFLSYVIFSLIFNSVLRKVLKVY